MAVAAAQMASHTSGFLSGCCRNSNNASTMMKVLTSSGVDVSSDIIIFTTKVTIKKKIAKIFPTFCIFRNTICIFAMPTNGFLANFTKIFKKSHSPEVIITIYVLHTNFLMFVGNRRRCDGVVGFVMNEAFIRTLDSC